MFKLFSRKILFRTALAATAAVEYLTAATPAKAQFVNWTEREGCTATVGETTVATFQGIECLVTNVLASATTIIGLGAFVMLIIGAFLYLTSGGNTKGTEAAKQTITYALIGIVVSLMAYFVLAFIAGFTGVGAILKFDLNLNQ